MDGKEAAKLLLETAERLSADRGKPVTVRKVCEEASSVVGTATFIEFEETGKIPLWLQASCEELLLKLPLRATDKRNDLGAVHHPIMADEDDCC